MSTWSVPLVGPATGAEPPAWFPYAGAGIGVLLSLVGLAVLLRVVPRVRRARTTTGTVVAVGREIGMESRAMWRLTMAFTDAQGVAREGVWTGQSSLDLTEYRPGMQLPLRYDPVSGAVVDLPGGRRPPALLVPSFLLVFGLLFAAFFWFLTS